MNSHIQYKGYIIILKQHKKYIFDIKSGFPNNKSFNNNTKYVYLFKLYSNQKKYKNSKINIINNLIIKNGAITIESIHNYLNDINKQNIIDFDSAVKIINKLFKSIKSQYNDLIDYYKFKYKSINIIKELPDKAENNLEYDEIVF